MHRPRRAGRTAALGLALLLAGCASYTPRPVTSLDCREMAAGIQRGEAEQNDRLIDKIAEMPVDLVSALTQPWTLGRGVLPDEDPIRLQDLKARYARMDCARLTATPPSAAPQSAAR
jgi:hypothetical protein